MEQDTVFALDIGTRKITGLVMQRQGKQIEVLGSETIEHSTRAVLDGQIHDVEAVAANIREIKERLENRMNMSFEKAAVAAAGRALKTAGGQAYSRRNYASEISSNEVLALEVEAVQEAQYKLAQQEAEQQDGNAYFCVGYSVNHYYLEEQIIGSLVGQVGHSIGVEVVATFLPRVVVDSLFSSLRKAGLGVHSMTLEPIAALSIAIPPNMRLLNLALVDAGAGTSDMAIIKNDSIYAYAMVPLGGDEITEKLAALYLLDFNTAEELKCSLGAQEEVSFTDILGNEIHLSSAEIMGQMETVVKEWAVQISHHILELNGEAPDAVLCVGGGSQTPGLSAAIAACLEIPPNRVGVRTREGFKGIAGDFKNLEGPQGVTPLGIAYHCFEHPPIPFFKVWVNEREVALWNRGEMDIASALLSSGISLNNIYGRPGMGKTINVNGYLKVFKGEMGTAPTIRLNGREASLETSIRDGDRITFEKGSDGQDAVVKIDSLAPAAGGYVFVNGEKIAVQPQVKVNGQWWDPEQDIPDRAQVEIQRLNSIRDVLARAGVAEEWLTEKLYHYFLNDQAMILRWTPLRIKVDGRELDLEDSVRLGASIEYQILHKNPLIRDVIDMQSMQWDCTVIVNGERVRLQNKGSGITSNGRPVSYDEELYNGMRLQINQGESGAILSDVFGEIDIQPSINKKLLMTVDGEKAGFTTPIQQGSVIELKWE